jgi:RimK family alpha-L-glutamate ligase
MKGKIIVNTFLRPIESINQAKRLKEEFNLLGVSVDIINDGYLSSMIVGNNIVTDLFDTDFVVYLDKDKYLSKELETRGVRVFNSHDAIRLCDDKGETYIALSGQGINIPDTIFGALCYSAEDKIDINHAKKIADKLSFPIIIKECFGSMGKGVYLANDLNELAGVMEKVKLKPHLFQKYIDCEKGVDYRVIVIGGKAVAQMKRSNTQDFRSNIARGGMGDKVNLPDSFIKTAEKCATVLGLDYCGVDLLKNKNGEPVVCEVNSNAFTDGIEKTTGVNVCALYAKHIINSLKNKVY